MKRLWLRFLLICVFPALVVEVLIRELWRAYRNFGFRSLLRFHVAQWKVYWHAN